MATTGVADDKLPQLVQSLPQELYDHILGLVFKSQPHFTPVTEGLTPPVQLHVDKSSRATFAKEYYGNGVFRFHDLDLLCKWIIALTPEQCRLLGAERVTLRVHEPKLRNS